MKPKNLYETKSLRCRHSVFHYYTLTVWHFSTTSCFNPLKRKFYVYGTILVANNFGYGLGTPSEDKTLRSASSVISLVPTELTLSRINSLKMTGKEQFCINQLQVVDIMETQPLLAKETLYELMRLHTSLSWPLKSNQATSTLSDFSVQQRSIPRICRVSWKFVFDL